MTLFFFYGRLGEVTKEEKTVEAKTPSVQRKTFTTEYVFDSFGRMNQMTYPDGETLYYAYDNGGLLRAAWGEKKGNRYDYIAALIYDEFDQRLAIAYGNGSSANYTYDPTTRRLKTLRTMLPGGRVIQNLSYQYDLVGNVLNLANDIATPTNTALPAGPVRQTFGYDDLYQLTTAQGAYAFGPGKENRYQNEFLYDTIGNFVHKKQEHTIYQPSDQPHRPKETNYVLNYQYTSAKPHAVTETDDKLYTYDPAGNMLGWTSKQNGTKRVITWNEENRVKQVDDSGKSTYFLYDDSGERVVKRGQHGETIYVNRFFTVRNGELGTKSVYAGETRVVSKLVKTPNTVTANSAVSTTTDTSTASIPGEQGLDHGQGKKLGIIKRLPDGYQAGVNPPVEKDQFYYHGDHLGSSNMITDAYGAVYQHLEYFPYGETWIEEGGSYGGNTPGYKFTGKELDPETGLYYYGARYYDPVLSRWISADPILEKYLPTGNKEQDAKLPGMGGVFASANLSMYSYAWNRPVIMKDPDGNFTNPVEIMTIRSHQGDNLNPRSNTFGMVRTNRDGTPRPHQGIDLRAVNATKTFAVGDGQIVGIDRAGNGDYGRTITYEFTYNYSVGNFLYDLFTLNWGGIGEKISNSGKKFFAMHSHLSSINANLRVGARVQEGQELGRTGSSGNARRMNPGERHLHFEMRNRNPVGRGLGGRVDPAPFMQGLNSNPKDNRSDNKNEWQ